MNYLVVPLSPDPTILNNFQTIDNHLTDIFTRLALLEAWKTQHALDHIQIAVEQGVQDDRLTTNEAELLRLENDKVDKILGKELVKVEDLVGGDAASVANIQSIRDKLDALHGTPMLTGEFSGVDITSCILSPTAESLISIPLNKGDYVLNGSLSFSGDEGSKGELYFEVNGVIHEMSRIQFGGGITYGNAPLNAILKIANDNTNVLLRAKRTVGIKLKITSNDIAKSYVNFFKIN